MPAAFHVCPTCKRVKLLPGGSAATCEYCSEQMHPARSVRGRKILLTNHKTKKEIRE